MSPKNFQRGKISHKSGHTGGGGDCRGWGPGRLRLPRGTRPRFESFN